MLVSYAGAGPWTAVVPEGNPAHSLQVHPRLSDMNFLVFGEREVSFENCSQCIEMLLDEYDLYTGCINQFKALGILFKMIFTVQEHLVIIIFGPSHVWLHTSKLPHPADSSVPGCRRTMRVAFNGHFLECIVCVPLMSNTQLMSTLYFVL